MDLTSEQKQHVASWIKTGASIANVQRRLREEFQISLTYMDTRFLIDDLELDLVDKEPPVPAAAPSITNEPSAPDAKNGEAGLADETDPFGAEADAPAGASGNVTVDIDRLTRPGTVVSGTVTFSDGNSGKWALDQMGRLVFEATKPDYRPSQTDLQAFQTELSLQLQKHGF